MGVDYSGTKAAPRLDLGAAVMEFVDQASDFIGTRVAPIFKTKVKKGNYTAITRESLAQIADTKRAARSDYNRGSIGAKDKSFSCEENGFEVPLDDSEKALYATDFDAELAAVKIGTGIVLRNQEARIATKLLDTAVFTGSALYTDVSAAPWTTVGSDAIAQIRTARSKVRANCGMNANYVAMSATNRDRLIALTVVKDAVKYTSRTTEQELINALADLLGVQYVLVANAIKNSAKEKQAFASADIWSATYVSVGVLAPNGQDLSQPTVARTFLWTEDCPENAAVESYREEKIRSNIYRVRQHTDEQIVDPYFAHLLKVV